MTLLLHQKTGHLLARIPGMHIRCFLLHH